MTEKISEKRGRESFYETNKKIFALQELFPKLEVALARVEKSEDKKRDSVILIEVLERLNNILPPEKRCDLLELARDSTKGPISKLRTLINHLAVNHTTLTRKSTLEELKKNIAALS